MPFGLGKSAAPARQTGRLSTKWTPIAVLALATLLMVNSISSAATAFKTLYEFQQGNDGNEPNGLLMFDAAGALYGTTSGGGGTGCMFGGQVIGCGTVFKLTPPATPRDAWTESILYRFTGGADGAIPFDGLVLDAAGVFFGTATAGGNSGCPNSGSVGCGTVFKLTPPATKGGAWTETVLYTFKGNKDGAGPNGSLIFDSSGALYGTTSFSDASGGCSASKGCGTVFKLTPPATKGGAWTETVLYDFAHDSAHDEFPNGVIFDTAGALYGTTSFSDASGGCSSSKVCGTVFKLTPPATKGGAWTETVLYDFDSAHGEFPNGVIFDTAGALYGTTSAGGLLSCGPGDGRGCGTVFRLAPPTTAGGAWVESALYRFTGGSDGFSPAAGLILTPQVRSTAQPLMVAAVRFQAVAVPCLSSALRLSQAAPGPRAHSIPSLTAVMVHSRIA